MKKIVLIMVAIAVLFCGCGKTTPNKIDVEIKDVEYIKVNFTPYTHGYFIDYNDDEKINVLVDILNNTTFSKWGVYGDLHTENFASDELQQGTISFYDDEGNIVFEFYLNGYLNYASAYRYCVIENDSIFVTDDEEKIDECVSEIVQECSLIASDILK